MYDQSKYSNRKHFCERCLHGYTTKALLERYKPECEGVLKRLTKLELPKQGETKVSFTSYQKHTKAPFVGYADLECLLRKIQGCEPPHGGSYTAKTEKHEPYGAAFTIAKSEGETFDPIIYRGKDARMSSLPTSCPGGRQKSRR